jgi:hypothetical protein
VIAVGLGIWDGDVRWLEDGMCELGPSAGAHRLGWLRAPVLSLRSEDRVMGP